MKLLNETINIKIKLALLWTSLMFIYIYADYFHLMTPDKIDHMMKLKTPIGPTTPNLLVIFSVILLVPSLMIPVSVLVKSTINKWLNIFVAIIYSTMSILIIVNSLGFEWENFFVLYNFVELILFITIIYQSWKWPKEINT